MLKAVAGALPPDNVVVGFVGQGEQGIAIFATRGGHAISTDDLQKTPLMVEISRIG